jgi:membrane protease YdiL (CAAX protease family)
MAFWLKFAGVSGAMGLAIMFALWMIGLPPRHLWLLAFWPSQFVGLGMDGVNLFTEMVLQFAIYAAFGLVLGFVFRIVRSNA